MQGESLIFWIFLVFGVAALYSNIIADDCGSNTITTFCGNPCQETCGQLKPRYCSKICVPNGCVCKPGYIRRDENGPCIPESWCRIVSEKMYSKISD